MSDATLETPRLTLRLHALSDFDAMQAMWSDAAVTRFIGGRNATPDETWARLLRYRGHWLMLGYGFWVIEERASGAYLGEIGYADFRRGLGGDFDAHPEMGWSLATIAHGKGYAHEAAQAAISWGRTHFAGAPIVCMISPENAPSIRLAEKIGFREFARRDFKGSPSVLFRTEA